MLAGKFPPGIRVVKDYRVGLPRIPAYAGELNQVWTNLIDNAVAAMGEAGTLTVRTGLDRDDVFVEFGDTGPGVPPRSRSVSSSRSSPPSRWGRAPGSGSTSAGGSW